MLTTQKTNGHPMARLLASTALILLSASYVYWQNFKEPPKTETGLDVHPSSPVPRPAAIPTPSSAPAPVEAAPSAARSVSTPSVADKDVRPKTVPSQTARAEPQPSAIAPAAVQPSPVTVAPVDAPAPVAMAATPAGTHLEDGEYVGQHEDFEWGTVQVKIMVRSGAIADVQFLQIPDHRARSAELSDLAKPVLIREAIRDQKSAVDVVSSATYTSMAYQDSLADAILKATR